MRYRRLGKTGFKVSEVSLGTWQVGGKWGSGFNDNLADSIINTAVDSGINFIDTADVYESRKSEHAVARVVKSRKERVYVATKCGRMLDPHTAKEYKPERLREFVEESLKNTGFESLDLIQLHCPPTEALYRPEVFEEFDKLKDEGKIQNLGVSVEKVEEGLKAIEFPNVTTIQIIYNMFRHRPAELFFEEAAKKDVGIIVRVPLASGLLSGKFSKSTDFAEGDHRNFNIPGESFSGIDYNKGIEAVEKIKGLFPEHKNLAPVAIKWVLMNKNVSCVIPGASSEEQVKSNIKASDLPEIDNDKMKKIESIYEEYFKDYIHNRW
ncbi:MAG: aldo/keto reductase [Chitinivibrionales bacterium]